MHHRLEVVGIGAADVGRDDDPRSNPAASPRCGGQATTRPPSSRRRRHRDSAWRRLESRPSSYSPSRQAALDVGRFGRNWASGADQPHSRSPDVHARPVVPLREARRVPEPGARPRRCSRGSRAGGRAYGHARGHQQDAVHRDHRRRRVGAHARDAADGHHASRDRPLVRRRARRDHRLRRRTAHAHGDRRARPACRAHDRSRRAPGAARHRLPAGRSRGRGHLRADPRRRARRRGRGRRPPRRPDGGQGLAHGRRHRRRQARLHGQHGRSHGVRARPHHASRRAELPGAADARGDQRHAGRQGGLGRQQSDRPGQRARSGHRHGHQGASKG